MGLSSKSQTMEMKGVAATREKRRDDFFCTVTPSEIIILILFQVILGREGWIIFGRG